MIRDWCQSVSIGDLRLCGGYLKDIQLADGGADRKHHDVEVHFRVTHHKLTELVKLLGKQKYGNAWECMSDGRPRGNE